MVITALTAAHLEGRVGSFAPNSPYTGYHLGSCITPNEQFGNKSISMYSMFVILCCFTVAIS